MTETINRETLVREYVNNFPEDFSWEAIQNCVTEIRLDVDIIQPETGRVYSNEEYIVLQKRGAEPGKEWAVLTSSRSLVLLDDGSTAWTLERSPSNRSDEALARTRFSLEEAYRLALSIDLDMIHRTESIELD